MWILTEVFCNSGPNLVVLAQKGDELSHGQAQNGVNFDIEVKFDLRGQGQSLPKTTVILTKIFYSYGLNLVILAERGDELSHRQARDWRTDIHAHRQTDAGNDSTRRPKLASGKKCTKVNRYSGFPLTKFITYKIWCMVHQRVNKECFLWQLITLTWLGYSINLPTFNFSWID